MFKGFFWLAQVLEFQGVSRGVYPDSILGPVVGLAVGILYFAVLSAPVFLMLVGGWMLRNRGPSLADRRGAARGVRIRCRRLG